MASHPIDSLLVYRLLAHTVSTSMDEICRFLLTIFLMSICEGICVMMLVFTGYLVDVTTPLAILRWIKWISVFRYASDGMTTNELTNLTLCHHDETDLCVPLHGEIVLQSLNIDHRSSWDLWMNFVALSVLTLLFFLFTFAQLCRVRTPTRTCDGMNVRDWSVCSSYERTIDR
jgi:hypothetical protein